MAKFTIGLDAELILETKTGQLQHASGVVHGTTSKFGTDGNPTVAEIRPTYAESPIELVKNIKTTMQRAVGSNPRLANVRWLAGAHQHGLPIGAHIHFGHPKFLSRVNGRPNNAYLVNMKDVATLLDCLVLPFATMFGNPAREKMRRANYGRPGDVRQQNWGMEYRSCSSFIASPCTTLFILTTAFAVVNEYLEDRLSVSKIPSKLRLNNDEFRVQPSTHAELFLQERVSFIKGMQSVTENPKFTEIVRVGCAILKQGQYEDVKDMKTAWKLKFSLPEEVRYTELEAWAEVGRGN